jgi:hypothetical protein
MLDRALTYFHAHNLLSSRNSQAQGSDASDKDKGDQDSQSNDLPGAPSDSMGWAAKLKDYRTEDQKDESLPDIDLFDYDWEALPADILRKHVQKMTGSEDAGRMIHSSRFSFP